MNQIAEQKSNSYLIFIALTAAFGGFFFGYDTAVISGTISLVKHPMTDIGVKQFEIDAGGLYDIEYLNFK